MRTTIYIPDELVDEIKEAAWVARKSLSQYLVDLHRGEKVAKVGSSEEVHKVSPKVIKTVEDIPQSFRSYSKSEQLGKKK